MRPLNNLRVVSRLLHQNNRFRCVQKNLRSFASAPSDPYKILNVNPNSTLQDIKANFRELAKKYHPDLNTEDKDAQSKMAEVTAAYDLLTDPKRRAQYDAKNNVAGSGSGSANPGTGGGSAGPDFRDPSQMFSDFADVFGRSNRWTQTKTAQLRGQDISLEVEIPFMDAINGCDRTATIQAKGTCKRCGGTGAKPGTQWTKCHTCKGTGVQKVDRGVFSMGVPCNVCMGAGEILEHPCTECKGEGVSLQRKDVNFKVPAGVRDAMEIRITGEGHAGQRGGPSGNMFVIVKVAPHDEFRHVDDDIHVDVPLSLKQMLLGGNVTVPTLSGPQKFRIPPKTLPASTKSLRGQGAPRLNGRGRGQFVFHFQLKWPEQLSPKQLDLIEEFDRLENDFRDSKAKKDGDSKSKTDSTTADCSAGTSAEPSAADLAYQASRKAQYASASQSL